MWISTMQGSVYEGRKSNPYTICISQILFATYVYLVLVSLNTCTYKTDFHQDQFLYGKKRPVFVITPYGTELQKGHNKFMRKRNSYIKKVILLDHFFPFYVQFFCSWYTQSGKRFCPKETKNERRELTRQCHISRNLHSNMTSVHHHLPEKSRLKQTNKFFISANDMNASEKQ